jgi:hypothetical protein
VRGRSALAPLAVCTLCACSPKAQAPPWTPVALDCAQPFEAQAAKITAQPHLLAPSHAPGEPYTFYSTDDGHASYLITEPGAPGHPAIMMQRARGGDVVTTGCRYGDQKGYNQLLAYLDSLKTWARK